MRFTNAQKKKRYQILQEILMKKGDAPELEELQAEGSIVW